MIAIVIPVAGVIYLLVRLARRSTMTAWRATAGKPAMRALTVALGGAVLCGLAYAWWPNDDNYRPIQPGERGTIGDIVYALKTDPMSAPRTVAYEPVSRTLVAGQQGLMQTVWDTRTSPPTVNSPQLAVILVPRTTSAAVGGGGGAIVTAPTTTVDKGWVFPFDKPLAPEPGDNQALAVNTTDGTVVYDAAFALVWTTDANHALNVNEAHAYASCDTCAAVAVAYQVVFVIDTIEDNDNVAVPQNLAGALNYECVNCLTYALAQQLFVTLDEPLSEEAMADLRELWKEIAAYGEAIEAGEVPLDEIEGRLEEFTTEIKIIIETDQPGTFPSATATPTAPATEASSDSIAPSAPPSQTVAPPSSEAPPPTDATAPDGSVTSDPTAPSVPTEATTPDGSVTSDPTAPSEPTSDASTSDGSATDGATSDGTVSSP